MKTRLPTLFLSHGGGPWPYMTGPFRQNFAGLETSLRNLPKQLGLTPKAIVAISGHWEESDFAVMASPNPPMVHDYSGFPVDRPVRYPAPGSPELAAKVSDLIRSVGLTTHLDPVRGFDHGTYSLLEVMYPEAAIPVIQVSIRRDYDPQAHWELGRALAPLRDEGILLIGSGSSYHNLRSWMAPNARTVNESAEFDAWLQDALVQTTPAERLERLMAWGEAPYARAVHPEEDHLVPLHVVVGAAENEPGEVIYTEQKFFGHITLSNYRFGAL